MLLICEVMRFNVAVFGIRHTRASFLGSTLPSPHAEVRMVAMRMNDGPHRVRSHFQRLIPSSVYAAKLALWQVDRTQRDRERRGGIEVAREDDRAVRSPRAEQRTQERSSVSLREHGRSVVATLCESDGTFESYVQARWQDAFSNLPQFARSFASPQIWYLESAVSLRAEFESQVQGRSHVATPRENLEAKAEPAKKRIAKN